MCRSRAPTGRQVAPAARAGLAPQQTPVNGSGRDRRDVAERAEQAATPWPVMAIAAGVGAILALALARSRSTTLALMGRGVLLCGAGLWLGAGFTTAAVGALGSERTG